MATVRIVSTAVVLVACLGGTPITSSAAPLDAWVTVKSKIALLTSREVGIEALRLNVDTRNGRVTLQGKLPSAAAKSAAGTLVGSIDGVTGVRNLVQIDEREIKDGDIESRVGELLKSDPSLADSRIVVEDVEAGVVTLGGEASTMSDHLRALMLASGQAGVRHVASNVKSPDVLEEGEIEYPPEDDSAGPSARGPAAAAVDLWITTETKLRLMADERIAGLDVNVDTVNGAVTLFGSVTSEEAKSAAGDVTARVNGVRAVNNLLEVVPVGEEAAVETDDASLRDQIVETFSTHEMLGDVGVEVSNRVVRLTGSAPSNAARVTAAILAGTTDGVRSVQNDVLVEEVTAEKVP